MKLTRTKINDNFESELVNSFLLNAKKTKNYINIFLIRLACQICLWWHILRVKSVLKIEIFILTYGIISVKATAITSLQIVF